MQLKLIAAFGGILMRKEVEKRSNAQILRQLEILHINKALLHYKFSVSMQQ